MISLSSLERRLAVLERPYLASIDPEKLSIEALDILDDTELGILEEFYGLQQSGFAFEEISGMMGEESYRAAIATIEKADREYKRLIEAAHPRRHVTPLKPSQEPIRDEIYDTES